MLGKLVNMRQENDRKGEIRRKEKEKEKNVINVDYFRLIYAIKSI